MESRERTDIWAKNRTEERTSEERIELRNKTEPKKLSCVMLTWIEKEEKASQIIVHHSLDPSYLCHLLTFCSPILCCNSYFLLSSLLIVASFSLPNFHRLIFQVKYTTYFHHTFSLAPIICNPLAKNVINTLSTSRYSATSFFCLSFFFSYSLSHFSHSLTLFVSKIYNILFLLSLLSSMNKTSESSFAIIINVITFSSPFF